MRFRKLRIAFSATCLIACVLLIVLWARSYVSADRISGDIKGRATIALSHTGRLQLVFGDYELSWDWPRWDSAPIKLPQGSYEDVVWRSRTLFGFGWMYRELYINYPNGEIGWGPSGITGRSFGAGATGFMCPYWCTVLAVAVLAALPWIGWKPRFTVRTLLIAMTLVAVVLGLIVLSIR